MHSHLGIQFETEYSILSKSAKLPADSPAILLDETSIRKIYVHDRNETTLTINLPYEFLYTGWLSSK